MRVMVLLGGLALAAVLALPVSAAAGGASAIAGAPVITNPALPAPPVPRASVILNTGRARGRRCAGTLAAALALQEVRPALRLLRLDGIHHLHELPVA